MAYWCSAWPASRAAHLRQPHFNGTQQQCQLPLLVEAAKYWKTRVVLSRAWPNASFAGLEKRPMPRLCTSAGTHEPDLSDGL